MKSVALPFQLAALSVVLLAGRLAVIYAPPAALISVAVAPAKVATAPPTPSPNREDAALFTAALRLGLLREDAAGHILIAPADLPLRRRWAEQHPELLTTPSPQEPYWVAMPWNQEISRLHRALHFSNTGRYVREQIQAFNEQRPEFFHNVQRQNKQLIWRERR